MPTPRAHAVLSPSSSARWLACPPSARLSEKFDVRFGKKESVFAAEGTRAHALGEAKIRWALYQADGYDVSSFSRLSPGEQESYPGINEYRYKALRESLGEIPADIDHATDSYCDLVMHRLLSARDVDPGTQLYLEQQLDISKWAPEAFGSSDAVLVSDTLLEVIDFKAGKGIPVDAHGNSQLRLYALGADSRFGCLFDYDRVRYTIVQPRLDNLSEEELPLTDLLAWGESIKPTAELAWKGAGEFNPGEHCRWCSAKAVCAARVSKALSLFSYGMEQPGTLTDEQIADILPFLDDAEDWITDIREYAVKQAQFSGVRYRGYKLVQGKKGNRQWSDVEEAEAVLLRAGYPPEAVHETRLKPVGQIENQIGKTAFNALLGGLVSQKDGKPVLVPESDKRIEISTAENVFGDLTK